MASKRLVRFDVRHPLAYPSSATRVRALMSLIASTPLALAAPGCATHAARQRRARRSARPVPLRSRVARRQQIACDVRALGDALLATQDLFQGLAFARELVKHVNVDAHKARMSG